MSGALRDAMGAYNCSCVHGWCFVVSTVQLPPLEPPAVARIDSGRRVPRRRHPPLCGCDVFVHGTALWRRVYRRHTMCTHSVHPLTTACPCFRRLIRRKAAESRPLRVSAVAPGAGRWPCWPH